MGVRCLTIKLVIIQTIRHDSTEPFFCHKIFDRYTIKYSMDIREFILLFTCYELVQLYLFQKQDRIRVALLGEHLTEPVK